MKTAALAFLGARRASARAFEGRLLESRVGPEDPRVVRSQDR